MIGKRQINSMSFEQLNAAIWKGRGPNSPVSLTEIFTVDALFNIIEHPEWERFPTFFKDWVRSSVDRIYTEHQIENQLSS